MPGLVAGGFDPARHVFENPSPVPLVATYETRHVLVSTTLSKSVLRIAADTCSTARDWVDYFPSYEFILGNYNLGTY